MTEHSFAITWSLDCICSRTEHLQVHLDILGWQGFQQGCSRVVLQPMRNLSIILGKEIPYGTQLLHFRTAFIIESSRSCSSFYIKEPPLPFMPSGTLSNHVISHAVPFWCMDSEKNYLFVDPFIMDSNVIHYDDSSLFVGPSRPHFDQDPLSLFNHCCRC